MQYTQKYKLTKNYVGNRGGPAPEFDTWARKEERTMGSDPSETNQDERLLLPLSM